MACYVKDLESIWQVFLSFPLCLSFWKMLKRWSFSLTLNSPGTADWLASEVGVACLGLKLQVCATVVVFVCFLIQCLRINAHLWTTTSLHYLGDNLFHSQELGNNHSHFSISLWTPLGRELWVIQALHQIPLRISTRLAYTCQICLPGHLIMEERTSPAPSPAKMETTFHVQISLPCEMSDWKSEASQTPSVECDRKNRSPVGASVRTKTSSVFDVSWYCQDPWHSETLRTVLETPAALEILLWIRPREEKKTLSC